MGCVDPPLDPFRADEEDTEAKQVLIGEGNSSLL